jgi:8-oxo-dGTP pyrophosphatase MutT (NUDIX family)
LQSEIPAEMIVDPARTNYGPMAELTDFAQVAALPISVDTGGSATVMLVTSRDTGRWLIPKGWPMKGRKPWEAAAQEALEEAGLIGEIGKTPVGHYTYFKRRKAHFDFCRVDVFLLTINKQRKKWREQGQRKTQWFTFDEAATLVDEPGLVSLLRELAGSFGTRPK